MVASAVTTGAPPVYSVSLNSFRERPIAAPGVVDHHLRYWEPFSRAGENWYLGYALDEALPDHSSLSRIRTRLGLEIFERFSERVVELCRAAGLVWGTS